MKNNSRVHRYVYRTRGVCPPEIHFEVEDGRIRNLRFVGGGCPGNAQLVSRLLEGKSLVEVLNDIKGIDCRNDTSCPQELAAAIEAVRNGTLAKAQSFRVQKDDMPKGCVALIGDLAGANRALENILAHIREYEVDAVLCLGNLIGESGDSQNVIKTIRRQKLLAIQGENDWHCSQNGQQGPGSHIQPGQRDRLYQLPQVVSFNLNARIAMVFFGDYIQSMPDYSDFEPFALEINMVCGLSDFMRDDTVFAALEAMTPQFLADIVIFSQVKTWGIWHIGDKDFISVGAASADSGLNWGLLTENSGRVDLKVMQTPP